VKFLIREPKGVVLKRIKGLIESYVQGKKEKIKINQIKGDIESSIKTKILERNDVSFLLIEMDLNIRSNNVLPEIPVEIKLERFDVITQQLGFQLIY